MPPPTHEANFSRTGAFITKLCKKKTHVLEQRHNQVFDERNGNTKKSYCNKRTLMVQFITCAFHNMIVQSHQ